MPIVDPILSLTDCVLLFGDGGRRTAGAVVSGSKLCLVLRAQ
jgi:hypothetical protein